MEQPYSILYSFVAASIICLLSLSGAVFFFISPKKLAAIIPFLVSLAIGVLLGNAFIHLIPDAVSSIGSIQQVSLITLLGILLFFFIEKGMHWRHHHEIYISQKKDGSNHGEIKPMGRLNLMGDFIHNFTDGALIAGSFAASPHLGVITTLAIAAHELPQEISDTGTLVYSGYSLKKAIKLNFLCSLSCLLGVASMILLDGFLSIRVEYILPVTAGGFIYIATSDMMPELQQRFSFKSHVGQGIGILAGLGIMILTVSLEKFF
jgi:zinc and cadmium transporter